MRKFNLFARFIPVVIISLLAGGFLQAQSISVGVKGGLSIPNLTSGSTSNPLNSGYSSGLGPDAALFGEYHLSSLFSIELSAEYSSQGGKKNGKQALPVPDFVASQYPPGQAPAYLWANYDASAQFNYLLIPVLAKFGFDLSTSGAWRVYADAGPFVGFLLSAKSITKGSSNVYADEAQTMPLLTGPISFDTTLDIKSELNSTNYGVAANIGISYRFGDHQVFLEGGGNYGFQVLQKNKEDGENHAGAAVVRIGYAFTFGGGGGGRHSAAVKEPKKF